MFFINVKKCVGVGFPIVREVHILPVVSQDVVFSIVRGWENKSLSDQSGDSAPAAASRAAAVAGSFPPPGLIQHLYLQPEPETKQFEVNDA